MRRHFVDTDSRKLASKMKNGEKAIEKWWAQLDSNQRPRDYESPALTN